MGDEHDGLVDDPRVGRKREAGEDAQGIARQDDGAQAARQTGGGGEAPGLRNEKDPEEAIAEAIESIAYTAAWQGPLPPPDTLSRYDAETRAKIISWVDREVKAKYEDESARQDELVREEVRQGRFGQAASAAIIAAALLFAALIGLLGGNTAIGCAFLALPLATIAANLFVPIRAHRKEKPPEIRD